MAQLMVKNVGARPAGRQHPEAHTYALNFYATAELERAKTQADQPIAKQIRLLPGVNMVDALDWAEVIKTPAVAALVKNHTFQVSKTPDDKTPLQVRADSEAIELVSETHDRVLLRAWRLEEKRSSVVEAIDQKIAVLSARAGDNK